MKDTELFIKEVLDASYSLGEIVEVKEIKAGDTNNSFMAYVKSGNDGDEPVRWYVRQYNEGEEERDIIFEHALEEYMAERVNGEVQTILPVKTKAGGTWVVEEYKGRKNFYAVFNVISGNEPYSWEYNNMSEAALDSCAEITAKFHAWSYGFRAPEGSGKSESPLEEQFGEWKECFRKGLEAKKEEPEVFRRFTDYFEGEIDELCRIVDFCSGEFAKYKDDLAMCVNHKDLNPGNLMFDDDDRVCAVFDMDWCNYDYRIYDIAWMGYQAIASWDTDSWGKVPVRNLDRFVETYNKVMIERECPLGPLNRSETEFLPVMMIIGAIKVLADFIFYEEHHHDAPRLFVNSWRFIESVKDLKRYVDSKNQ